MTEKQINLSTRLKRLGYAKGNQLKLYGEVLDFLDDPIVVSDDVVLVDAKERKTGRSKTVGIPLTVVNMARTEGPVA